MARNWFIVLALLCACDRDPVQRATGGTAVAANGVGVGIGSGGAGGTGGGGGGGAGGSPGCMTDTDCDFGLEWCVGGSCVACDNSAPVCNLACPVGWATYLRNGCTPCECAPINDCTQDADCGAQKCYAGYFCADWCPAGDPSCCFGNVCDVAGCGPNPTGCTVTGCPQGQQCIETGCVPSTCTCDAIDWICGPDCNGGLCQ